jgi:hypothetical protein
MNIDSISQILQNRISALNDARVRAISVGDLEQVNTVEKDLLETQNTLQQLAMLTQVESMAQAANTTPADIVASGLSAVQNTVQGPSAGAMINGYDISAYATDPLYEQKIQGIMTTMPTINSAEDVDVYIQSVNPGSPVTGNMVIMAVGEYGVDIYLLLAIMQNDSSFGTLGVGARTYNPGNVGNTGSSEKSYLSWDEGVKAVADWLNRHRISV